MATLEGRLLGVFGSDPGIKSSFLNPITKKGEVEGVIVHNRSEGGISYSFLDDSQFPDRIQGYARIASISDAAYFMYPRYGRLTAADGELAVLIDCFTLPGSIVSVDEEAPATAGSYFRGTCIERYQVATRSSQSSVIELTHLGPSASAPKGTLVYIDRAFNVKGVGLVVLGFLLGGSVSVHDDLRLIPSEEGRTAEVRGIQVNDVDQESVGRGMRVGLSLKGVELNDLSKVSWLDDGSHLVSETLSVDFRQSQFYKQQLDGRDLHLQLPGEMVTCKVSTSGPRLTASLGSKGPVWPGMSVSVIDLNGKGLRVAGGGHCVF